MKNHNGRCHVMSRIVLGTLAACLLVPAGALAKPCHHHPKPPPPPPCSCQPAGSSGGDHHTDSDHHKSSSDKDHSSSDKDHGGSGHPTAPAVIVPPPAPTVTTITNTVIVYVNAPVPAPTVRRKIKTCPAFTRSRFHVVFTPQGVAHGNATYRAWGPAAVKRIRTTVYGSVQTGAHRWSRVSRGSSVRRSFNVADGRVFGFSSRSGTYGLHRVVTRFVYGCGAQVVSTFYFNNDPPARRAA